MEHGSPRVKVLRIYHGYCQIAPLNELDTTLHSELIQFSVFIEMQDPVCVSYLISDAEILDRSGFVLSIIGFELWRNDVDLDEIRNRGLGRERATAVQQDVKHEPMIQAAQSRPRRDGVQECLQASHVSHNICLSIG